MNVKKISAAVTALLMSASLASLLPQSSIQKLSAMEVYVSNDFDVTYEGWINCGEQVQLTADEQNPHGGTRSMHVANRLVSDDGVSSAKGFYLEGGRKYDYSVYVKHNSENNEKFNLTLTYLCEDGVTYETVELASETVASGEWVKIDASYKAPKNVTEFIVKLTTDSTTDFWFDDFTVIGKQYESSAVSASGGGLKDEFANYFRVGNILNGGTVQNSTILATILKNYNSIECENETKPDATLVQSQCTNNNIGVSLNSAASIFDFCIKNNIGVRGHTLVWHSQTPVWFFKDNFQSSGNWVSASVMDQRLESYIKNMFNAIKTQYPTLNLYAYDVANECISDDSNRTQNNGGTRVPGENKNGESPWVQVYGSNIFVEKAFTYARQYAPEGCDLYYNDYNEYWDHKRDAIYSMCKSLYEKGLLDGVGMQSHINADASGFSGTENYIYAMKKYLSIGCDVQITELDISTEGGKFSAQQQADKYAAIFQAAVDWNKNPQSTGRVTAVCIWGPNDANTWIKTENAPLLHDTNNQPKAAYTKLASLLPQSEWGDGDNYQGGTPAAPIEPDSNGYYFHDTFEGSLDDWSARGGCEVLTSGRIPYKGTEALLVMDRTDAWNGGQKSLSTRMFEPGKEYAFSACFATADGPSQIEYKLTLQYEADGETHYDGIAQETTVNGEYVQLYNPSYKIPEGATNMYLVVETTEETCNFYVDEIIGAVAGTKIDGPSSKKLILGDIDNDGRISVADLILVKNGVINGFDSAADKYTGDIDSNTVNDAADALALQQYLLGIITEFPVAEIPEPEKTPFNYNANLTYSEAPGSYLEKCSQAGKIINETYNGINGSNKLNVYLPYGYDSSKQYNIFYLMHGGGENEDTIFSDDVKLGNILDHMIMNGELEPLIVVTPTFNKCEARTFYNEFRQSVIPFVESKYSTYAKSTSAADIAASRMHRAYGGFSMGSASTWAVLVNSLDICAYYMPLSGDNWEAEGGYNKAKSVADAIDKSGLKSNEYFIMCATGSDDIAYPNMNPQIDEMKKMSQFIYTSDFSKGNFYYLVAEGKSHWWGYVRHYVYDALPYFFHE